MPVRRNAGPPTAIPRPAPIPNGSGKKFMKMTLPVRTVELDAGVFDYLWRIAEAQYLRAQHGVPLPEHLDLMERTVGAFRSVMKLPEREPTTAPVPRRVIKRK